MSLLHRATRLVRCRLPLWAALAPMLACSGDPAGDAGPGAVQDGTADASTPANHALSFNGMSAYASTGTAQFPSGNSPQTISLWVRYSSAAQTQAFFVLHNDSGGGLKLGLRNGQVSAWTVMEGSTLVATSTLPSLGKWHHIAYVFDGATNYLYVDGKESAKKTLRQNWNFYVASWLGSTDGLGEFFAGAIDEVRLWSVARSSSQIAKEMTGQVSPVDRGLVLYLDCNAVFGTRLADRSGNGNDATLGGGDPLRMPTLVPSSVPSK